MNKPSQHQHGCAHHSVWPQALTITLAGCGFSDEPSIQTSSAAIVYGRDDRREVFEAENERTSSVARAVAAFVPSLSLEPLPDNKVRIVAKGTSSELNNLCPGARFAEQPAISSCTGSLVDADLLLTAGHCVNETTCSELSVIFGFYYEAPGALRPTTEDNVYRCKQVLTRDRSATNDGRAIDYAIIQLDRAVVDREPLSILDADLLPGTPLIVLSTPEGVPLKVDEGALVLDSRHETRDYFVLNADTFEGSSGAPVFLFDGSLAGVFVRGNEDYTYDVELECNQVNVSPEIGEEFDQLAEEATYAAVAVAGLCARGFPSQRLCGRLPQCGDGYCSHDERPTLCPADCTAPGPSVTSSASSEPKSTGSPRSTRTASDGCHLSATNDGWVVIALLAFARSFRRRRAA